MIYGYNAKLLSGGTHTIMSYGRDFVEGLTMTRRTLEV